jgi:hypothetical protein
LPHAEVAAYKHSTVRQCCGNLGRYSARHGAVSGSKLAPTTMFISGVILFRIPVFMARSFLAQERAIIIAKIVLYNQ